MKTKLLSFILLSVMLLGVLAGCGENPDTNITTAPETSNITESTGTTTAANATTALTEYDYSAIYDDLLFELYQHILAITYDSENSEDYEGTMGIREVVATLSETDALKTVGFATEDINDDTIPELLVYLIDDNGNEKCAGTLILAAFTYDGESPVLLFEGTSRNRYYLLSDGLIYNEGSSGAAYTIFGTYTLPENSTEIKAISYYFTAPDENDPETILYYHNETGDFDVTKSELFDGPENNFWQIQLDCSQIIKETELTPFEVFSAGSEEPDAEVSYVYATLIDYTGADLTNAQKFTADNSEYETEVVFLAAGEITDFAFCSVENIDYTDEGTYKAELTPMHTIDTLNENEPLIVTMTFWGDTPSYGITYTDSEGTNHSELIALSGVDGSVVLMAQ